MDNNVIDLFVSGMELSLSENNDINLKESNNYKIEIKSENDLTNYLVLLKKYGEVNYEELGPITPYIERLFRFKFNENNYWGKLSYEKTEEETNIYSGSFVTYEPIFNNTIIPKKEKIVGYNLKESGLIRGTMSYSEDSKEYNFELTEINFNDPTIVTPELDTIKLTISNNELDFPEPEKIDDQLIIDKNFLVSGTIIASIPNVNTEQDIVQSEDDNAFSPESANSFEENFNSDIDTEVDTDINDNYDENVDFENENSLEGEIEEDVVIENEIENEDDIFNEEENDEDFIIQEEEPKREIAINLENIDIQFTSYDSENGKYYYHCLFDNWTFDLTQGTSNLIYSEEESMEESTYYIKLPDWTEKKEYYKKIFDGELVIIFDENNFNNYQVKLSGEMTYIQEQNQGEDNEKIDVTIASYNFLDVVEYNGLTLDFSEFSFTKKILDKSTFQKYQLINTYSVDLESSHLKQEVQKIAIGVARKKANSDKDYDFMTNALEFKIEPAFISFVKWSDLDYYVTSSAYLIGKMGKDGQFYLNDKKKVLGRPNVVYIDGTTAKTTENGTVTDLVCYGWEPIQGFYEITSEDEEININNVD